MAEIIAYCGIACHTCPIFLATREADERRRGEMRAEIARLCREHYHMDFKAADINDCDGCRTEGDRLFKACATCAIRNCARKKGLADCAHCPDYACEELKRFFAKDSTAKDRLTEIRKKIGS